MNYFSKKRLSKILMIFTALIIIVSVNVMRVKAQITNYSGTWRLNEAQSDFGNLTKNSADIQLKITQDLGAIIIERFYRDDDGQKGSYSEKLTFDGKPVSIAIDSKTQKKVYASWSVDRKIFTESVEYIDPNDDEQISNKGSVVWTLSSDGKVLSGIFNLQEKNGLYHTKYVYDKID